jgi:uncharacterized phage-associated protein
MTYNARKAAQVVAYFAVKSPQKRIDVLKVIKLVYLADRESIRTSGFPILDEARVSMPHGPVNSMTYSHIQGEFDLTECGWSEFLRDRANHQVSFRHGAQEDWDELSEFEIACLDAVWDKFGQMDKWTLVNWTHDPRNVPEWEYPNGSSQLLPIERIMLAVGLENHVSHAEEVRSMARAQKVLSELST